MPVRAMWRGLQLQQCRQRLGLGDVQIALHGGIGDGRPVREAARA